MRAKFFRSIKLALWALLGTMFVVAARAQVPPPNDDSDLTPGQILSEADWCEHTAKEQINGFRYNGRQLGGYYESLPQKSTAENIDHYRQAETNPWGIAHNQIVLDTAYKIIQANKAFRVLRDGPCKIALDLEACTIHEDAASPGKYTAQFKYCKPRVIIKRGQSDTVFGQSEELAEAKAKASKKRRRVLGIF
jgi:hypothetical protein